MLPLTVPCKLLFKNCSALTSYMTSSVCHHFSLYSHGYGQYFPWSNFKKKNILVFSSLSSFRLGLSAYRLGEKGAPYFAPPVELLKPKMKKMTIFTQARMRRLKKNCCSCRAQRSRLTTLWGGSWDPIEHIPVEKRLLQICSQSILIMP